MAKQLNVNLAFSADTSQAKAQIQALSKSLQDIAKMPGNASNLFDDTQIRKASQAALELQQHLSQAVNVDTGKLDLSRFSSSLKTSNKDLSIYCDTLLSTGEKGQQAFLQLAQAIATADTPVTRVNKKLAEMGTTLKNTARWQISSSILHGFMGAVQSAYGYAQDLNESLNEIRIVTGQNIEQMSKFAAEANRAAKALSTTTTEYTDASLIYYQQGLSDSEVAKRTEVTIKMANAAGQSAQIVSDQLTAVWNNFYDGSKSLEYYADVMTALGAATASSTDEIAGGLEKFAAIGETIGLSYEYAASALATITSNTRQSEEVVGTALKTIFARIQGLNLGETLDDGTTLNKYSEALQKVGVSVFNASGELKDMDSILDEMAAKWETLGRAEQTALAQTVAGTRQYTQLVALMENWDNGDNDSMTANLNTSYGSSGALQEQADIYAESWEAAQDRVTAAAEHIYSSLINDEFFIDLLNGFEKVLETIGGLIDGLGGLKGVISVVGSVFLTSFAKKVPEALNNLRQNFMVFTGQSKKVMQEVQSELNIKLAEQQANPALSESYKLQLEGISKVNAMKQKLVLASKDLSDQEREEYEAKIKNVQAMYEEAAALAEKKKAAEELAATTEKTASESATRASTGVFDSYTSQQDKISSLEEKATNPSTSAEGTDAYLQALEAARQKAVELELQIEEVANAYGLAEDEIQALMGVGTDDQLAAAQTKIADKVKETTKAFTDQIKQRSNLENISTSVKSQAKAWQSVAKEIKKAQNAGNTKNLSKHVDETKQKMQQYLGVLQRVAKENGIKLSESMIKSMSETINGMNVNNIEQVTQKFSNFAQVISGKANSAISTLDTSIEDLRGDMASMQFNEGEIREMEQAAESAATTGQDLANSMDNIGGAADENVPETFKMSTALTEFASTAMSVSALVTSMQSAMSVFADEGATGFEKFGAAISVIVPLMSTFNALQDLSTTLSKQDKIAKLGAAAGQMAVNAMAALGISVKSAETGAVVANTAAWYANPIMWIALIIVGVVAALAALVAIITSVSKALSDAYNKDAIAAENAENAAKNLGEAYNQCKQEYEDMIAAFDSYKSARDALDNLTEGTKEYQDALKEANRQALDLINNYGLVEGQDYEWQGDELVIKDDAMERVAEEDEVDKAYAASQMAGANAKAMRAKADATDAHRSIRDQNGVGDGDKVWGAIDGALLNGLTFGVGGTLLVGHQQAKSAKYDAAIDKAIEEGKDNPNLWSGDKYDMAEQLGIDLNDEDLINALWENKDQLSQLSTDMNAAEQAWKLAAQNSANEILADNEVVQQSDNAEEVMAAGGRMYDVAYTDAYEKYLADAKDRGWFNTGTDESKAAMKQYAEAAGLTDLKGYEVTNYKGDGTVKYKYIDDEGEEQTKLVTAEEIAATLAAAEAMEKLGGSAEALAKKFNELDSSGRAADQAFKDFLSAGDFENAKAGEVTGENGILNSAEFKDGITADSVSAYLDNQLGDGKDGKISDETAKKYGYESAQAMVDAMTKELQEAEIAWDSIDLPDTLPGIENMSLKTAQAFENQIKKIELGPLGEGGGKAYVDGINEMVKGLNTEDQEAAMARLAEVDWSQWDALEQADAIMQEFGGDIDTGSEAWLKFAKSMRIANLAQPDFTSIKEDLISLTKIISDLEFGATVDDEAYQELIKLKPEYEEFFQLQADGTRRFIGDQQSMMQATRDSINEQRKELEERKKMQEGFVGAGWGHKTESGDWYKLTAEDWKNKSGADTGTATNLLNAKDDGATGKMLAELGYDDKRIQEIIDQANSTDEEIKKKGQEALALMYDAIGNFQGEDLDLIDTELDQMMASTATTFGELQQLMNNEDISTEAYNQQLQYLTIEAMNAATSISELKEAMAIGEQMGAEVDSSLYVDNLLRIAEGYSNCADEIEKYNQALMSGNTEAMANAVAAIELSAEIAETAEQFDLNAEEVENYAKRLQEANKDTGLTAKAAAQLAVANMRLDRGMGNLNDNLEDYTKALKSTNKGTAEWSKTMDALKGDLADVLNIADGNMISDAFAESMIEGGENAETLKKALDGDSDSILELRRLAAENIIFNIDSSQLNESLGGMDTIKSKWDELKSYVQDGAIQPGIETENFIAAFNEMAKAGNMTKEQIEAAMSGLNVGAELKTTYNASTHEIPYQHTWSYVDGYKTVDYYNASTGELESRSVPTIATKTEDAGTYVATEYVPSYEIVGTTDGSGGATTGVNVLPAPKASSSSTTSGRDGGGGGSKPKKAEKAKKSDVVDRYKQVDDKLDDVADAADDASKAIDRLYGADKLKKMQEVNKLLEKEINLTKKKREEAEAYLEEDKKALQDAAAEAGVTFSFDSEGNISNYESQMTALYEMLSSAIDTANADGDVTEEEQEAIDKIQEQIDAVKDAIAQYDETRELITDLDKEAQDKFNEWQDNNFEELNIELEYKLEVNDSKMEVIDYYMGKIEDDIYATAEAFGYLTQQSELYTDNLANQEQYVKDLTAKYEAGEISLQAYKEGLASSQSAIISNLQSLEESKQAMQDYYGNVMDMALEKIFMYTDEMDHLNSVLDHYSSIMELVGKQDDYATKNKILRSKANNIQGELQVQKELYEKSAAEAQKWAEKMATATEGSNEYETYKKNWQAAQAAANDAQDAMLSKTEEWAEAMKSIIENELAEMADTLEKSLTGGVSFDELLTSMERRSSLQEEYLTTTNQIYETNKMMRTAQQEIDKTSNTVAKKKLQNFINETNQLQNQTKLSQYELDIQQAKYDLLLAEIALQEAQDAKSTVRLQRDAEGNFGYVYTADANQVTDAEQKLADAQNNLYNIGLEGANDYQQKYAQTLQESQDAITELTQMWINGEISDYDEYERRKVELTEYYGEKLKQYSELHTIALSTDSRVLTDAWSSDFIERTASVEEWKGSVDEYFEGAAGSMEDWAEVTKQVLADSGLSDMDKALQEVDNKSNTLRKTLIGEDGKGGVVAAMMSEVETAGKVSDAHITIQNAIDKTIEKYEKLLTAVNNAHTAMDSEDNSSKNENNPNNNNNNNNKDNENKDDNKEEEKTLTWDRVYAAYKKINSGAWGNGMSRRISNGAAEGYTEEEVRKAQELINKVYGGSTLAAAKSALGFDTGGYTGDWSGSYGKLAMLHKKELVLKEGDTENFLASMELLERILSIIDLQSANAQLGGMLSSPSYGSHATETIVEQNVHIEASFPGISDRNELQETFTNLINQASQYANRK